MKPLIEGIRKGKEGVSSEGVTMKNFYAILAAVFLSGVGVPYALLSLRGAYTRFTRPECNATLWGIVIDAGSSGSRVHVFSWRRGRALETVREVSRLKRTPGLSAYHDPGHAAESLHKLLLHAHSIVPRACEAQTPVYLLATAGLRLTAPSRRRAILQGVRDLLQTTPYAFANENARVMDGGEEAEFDWLSVNVALQFLAGAAERVNEDGGGKDRPTVGVIDLGGASSQIAFETNAALATVSEVRTVILKDAVSSSSSSSSSSNSAIGAVATEMGGSPGDSDIRHIYAVSRLNFGMHEAYRLTHKISRSSSPQSNASDVWFACEVAEDPRDDLGDFFECEYLVDKFVAKHEPGTLTATTSIEGGGERPMLQDKPDVFYGIDNFAKLGSLAQAVTQWMKEETVAPHRPDTVVVEYDLAMFQNAGMHICSSPWPALRKMIPEAIANDHLLRHSCFGMAYVRALLRKVYGLRGTASSSLGMQHGTDKEKTAWPQLVFAHKIKGVDGSWALGAMVAHSFRDAGKFWKFDKVGL